MLTDRSEESLAGLEESNDTGRGLGVGVLMYDDTVTPDQYFGRAADSPDAWTGERKLLLAVIEDAHRSYCRYINDFSVRGRRLFQEVKEWFDSTDSDWVYSFENICDHIGLDAAGFRSGLRRWSIRHATRRPGGKTQSERK